VRRKQQADFEQVYEARFVRAYGFNRPYLRLLPVAKVPDDVMKRNNLRDYVGDPEDYL
jgi:hypothetical protein